MHPAVSTLLVPLDYNWDGTGMRQSDLYNNIRQHITHDSLEEDVHLQIVYDAPGQVEVVQEEWKEVLVLFLTLVIYFCSPIRHCSSASRYCRRSCRID